MKVFYCDHFVLPLPDNHRFPMDKYAQLRRRVDADTRGWFELVEPAAATDDQLATAHTDNYINIVTQGRLDPADERALGFPWSPELVERSRRSVGATIDGSREALDTGVALSLAGGTHHAYSHKPQGFCVFNDSVVAARVLQKEKLVERVVVIDCDVHQGNGTAAITEGDESIFTFSIHGAKNFPVRKEQSDLDIAVEDYAQDARYLALLQQGLDTVFSRFQPDLAIFLAGADPFEEDRWGRMKLSRDGLKARDDLVFRYLEKRGVPTMVTMAGGYARDIGAIVDIHFATVERAAQSSLGR